MSKVLCIHHGHEPSWPPTDQHPDARRYYVHADGRVVAAPLKGIRGEEIPASANTNLTEEERMVLAAKEGKAARAEKDRRAKAAEQPAPKYVVDAIGVPTLEEVLAMVPKRAADQA